MFHFTLQVSNAFRNAHRIYVKGSDVPDAVGSFEEMAEWSVFNMIHVLY